MKDLTIIFAMTVSWAVAVRAEESSRPDSKKQNTPESLKADVESLKAPKVAWREIQWKSCLLDGLVESRRTGKPLLLWVFIDRPVDDARC
jgi:hypothetical protein